MTSEESGSYTEDSCDKTRYLQALNFTLVTNCWRLLGTVLIM